jgi:flagellar basal-body rod protein FlgC
VSIFGVLPTSGSGLRVFRTWMDAISDNVANLNTVKPTNEAAFQERFVVAQSQQGGGAQVSGVLFGDPQGRMIYQPDHPLADAEGMVRYPDVDLGDQMTQLLVAQRGYQANLAVVERARDAYQAALTIGSR